MQDCRRFGIDPSNLPTGTIVGKATIFDTKRYQTKKELVADKKYHFARNDYFSSKTFGFLLKNPKEFKLPIPAKGKLGFFDVDLSSATIKDDDLASEIFDEEYRTRWINHH